MESKICLGPNYASFLWDCTEQCDDCKNFQHNMENPKKISDEEREEIKRNYKAIKSIANF